MRFRGESSSRQRCTEQVVASDEEKKNSVSRRRRLTIAFGFILCCLFGQQTGTRLLELETLQDFVARQNDHSQNSSAFSYLLRGSINSTVNRNWFDFVTDGVAAPEQLAETGNQEPIYHPDVTTEASVPKEVYAEPEEQESTHGNFQQEESVGEPTTEPVTGAGSNLPANSETVQNVESDEEYVSDMPDDLPTDESPPEKQQDIGSLHVDHEQTEATYDQAAVEALEINEESVKIAMADNSMEENTPADQQQDGEGTTASTQMGVWEEPTDVTSSETVSDSVETSAEAKPTFVFHFGPMKTGTTTLQRTLRWELQDYLIKDEWHYLDGDNPLHRLDKEDDYFEQFKRYADEYRAKGLNLIMSKEQHSVLYGFRPEMYEKLHETLKDDWNVEFVIAYRPYFEWLISLWQEANKWRDVRPWVRAKDGLPDRIHPFYPGYWEWHVDHGKTYTSNILSHASQFFKARVFNMYDPRGIRTTFVCDMIGRDRVPAACEESLRLDEEEEERNHMNKAMFDDVHLDAVSLRLAAEGKIDTEKFIRHDLINAALAYIKDDRQQTPQDLPHICPADWQYEDMLQKSLHIEAEIMPELAQTEGREATLREKLNKKIAMKEFCEIDVDALLQDEGWREFYAQFAKN